jgi:hypothetical protein
MRRRVVADSALSPSKGALRRAQRTTVEAIYASAMSTETSILDFFASVKITPLTGGTSP